jgi:hypothetical protein
MTARQDCQFITPPVDQPMRRAAWSTSFALPVAAKPQILFIQYGSQVSGGNIMHNYCLRAFSGKVDTGFPQKMRPNNESRAHSDST